VSGATVTGSSSFDLVVSNGGQINAAGATTQSGSPGLADTNVTTFNAIDTDGIIWS